MKKPILRDYGLSENKIDAYEKSLEKYQSACKSQEKINSSYNTKIFFLVAFLVIVYIAVFYILLCNGADIVWTCISYFFIQILVTSIATIKKHYAAEDAVMQFIYAITIPAFGLGAVMYNMLEHDEKYTNAKIPKYTYIDYDIEQQVLEFKKALFDWEELQNKTSMMYWNNLTGYEFEEEIARLYKILGYRTTLTPRSSDGGIDIILEKDSKRIAVQCKHHSKPVGPAPVRELMGVVASNDFDNGIFISLNGFTNTVYGEVEKSFVKIELLSLNDILYLVKSTSNDLSSHQTQTINIKTQKQLNRPYSAKNAPRYRRIFPRGKVPVLPVRQTLRFCGFAKQSLRWEPAV